MALRESSSATFHNCQFDDSVVPNSYESYGSSSDLTLGAYGGGGRLHSRLDLWPCALRHYKQRKHGGVDRHS